MSDYESSDFISDDSDETYDAADFIDVEDEELSEYVSSEADESDLDIVNAPFPYTAQRKKRVVYIDDYIYY